MHTYHHDLAFEKGTFTCMNYNKLRSLSKLLACHIKSQSIIEISNCDFFQSRENNKYWKRLNTKGA